MGKLQNWLEGEMEIKIKNCLKNNPDALTLFSLGLLFGLVIMISGMFLAFYNRDSVIIKPVKELVCPEISILNTERNDLKKELSNAKTKLADETKKLNATKATSKSLYFARLQALTQMRDDIVKQINFLKTPILKRLTWQARISSTTEEIKRQDEQEIKEIEYLREQWGKTNDKIRELNVCAE
jgi:hypothetical protein